MLDPNFHITTPRLYLVHPDPANQKHVTMIWQRFNEKEKVYFKKLEREFTMDDAFHYMQTSRDAMEKTGWGRYVILVRPESEATESEPSTPFSERSADLEAVGVVTMQCVRFPEVPAPNIPDVGFGLLPKVYAKGYATESARGLMKYYEDTKGCKAFGGYTDAKNEPAKRALRRLGMKEWGVSDLTGVGPGDEAYR